MHLQRAGEFGLRFENGLRLRDRLEQADGPLRPGNRGLRISLEQQQAALQQAEVGKGTDGLRVARLGGDDRLEQRDRLAIACERGRRVTLAGGIGLALHARDFLVSRCQLELERGVAAGFLRQRVEVLERIADEDLARVGRAGQLLDGVVDVEQQRVREPAHAREVPLGPGALFVGDPRLAQRKDRRSDERDDEQGSGGHLEAMAADELGGAIP